MVTQNALASAVVRGAWIIWGLVLLAACVLVVRQADRRPANDAYARGAARWNAASDLYVEGGNGFIYLPQSAMLYFPFTLLPRPAEHVLWRTASIGLFAAGVSGLCRLVGRHSTAAFFPIVSLLVLPKAWTCAINGQAGPAMAGLSMLALCEIEDRHWWRSAALLAAALAFKPLAIVLIFLLVALYRPLVVPMVTTLAAFAAAPFLAASPSYVVDQYLSAATMFRSAAERGLEGTWPQVFSLANLAGLNVPRDWQIVLSVAAGLGTLACCRCMRIRNPKSEIRNPSPLISIYALACCYLLLFNPRTENSSYLMLSPVMGVMAVHLFRQGRKWEAGLLGAGTIALFAGHEICQIATPHVGFVWIGPLVTLLFMCALVWQVLRETAVTSFGLIRSAPDSHLTAPCRDVRV